MSNFDDLPDWLKGDADDEPSSPPDDQASWTQPPDSKRETPAHFGVTGSLPWRQGASDDPKRQTSGLEDIDWDTLGDTDAGGDSDDLAWLNAAAFPDDESPQAEPAAGFPQWLGASDAFDEPDLDAEDLGATSAESMPSWLTGAEGFDETGAFDEPDLDMDDLGAIPAESTPNWLGSAESFGEQEPNFFEDMDATYDEPAAEWFEEAAQADAEPSFLRSLGNIEGEIEPEDLDGLLLDLDDDFAFDDFDEPVSAPSQPQEPRIRRLGAKKEEEEGELTFEQWERLQDQKSYETDHAEELAIQAEVPDWFRDNVEIGDAAGNELASILIPDLEEALPTAPPATAELKADYVPEWFMGLEEQSLDDAPDWIKDAASGGDLSSLTDISAFVPPAPEPEPIPESQISPVDDVPDWFKGIGVDLPDITSAPMDTTPTAGFDLPDLTGLPDIAAFSQASSTATPLSGFELPEDVSTAEDEFDFLSLEEDGEALETGDVPDWLRGYAPAEDSTPQAGALMFEDEAESGEMDWLEDLPAMELTNQQVDFSDLAAEIPKPKPGAKQPDRDILAGTGTLDELLGFVETTTASSLVPVQADRRLLAQQSQLTDLFDGVDDNLLQAIETASESSASPRPASEGQPQLALADMPDLIADLRPEEAIKLRAGGIELEFTEQSLTQLPSEIRNLQTRTAPPSPSTSMPTAGPLSGVTGGLGIVGLTSTASAPTIVTKLDVSNDQLARIEALAAVLEIDRRDEWQDEEEDEVEAEAKPRRRARRQRARRKPDRFIIALLLLAAVIGPFLTNGLHIGGKPETQKLGADQQAVLTAVSNLENNDRVLVAFEYGPTAAGELNGLAEAVLQDILRQGAVPVMLSTNPLGALNAENLVRNLADDTDLLDSLERDQALQSGQDYYMLRYISGGAAAIRGLTTSSTLTTLIFSTDSRGEKTNLAIDRVDASDFAMVVIIGETTEDVRNWAEQFDVEGLPKYALVSAAIEPLAQAYVGSAYSGFLAGYRDTYRYNQLRNPQSNQDTNDDLPDPTISQWYSMTLGVTAVGVVIALGTLINLLRGLRRRRV